MAKQPGLGDNLYIDGYDLSGDTGSVGPIHGGPKLGDVTGINKSAHERLGLVRDGGLNWTSFFNDANTYPAGAHTVLSALPTVDRILTYCRGTAIGSAAACVVAKQVDYNMTRGADGMLTCQIQAVANAYGLEWGRLATAGQRTDTTATVGATLDLGSASPGAFGLQAYLHVFAFAGTSVTVKLQESSDDGAGDAYADVVGGGFTAATTITKQRIATAAINVERYLKVVTTGTFTNAVFAVVVVRNDTLVAF